MPKTITLQDATVVDLLAALGAAQPAQPNPQPSLPAPTLPAGATLITTPTWDAGFTSRVPPGGSLVLLFVPTRSNPLISYANYAGSPVARTVTVSRTPADFRTTLDPSGENGPVAGRFGAIGLLAPMLTPGAQYYLNVGDRVWTTGAPVCKGGDCGDIIVIFQ